MTADFDKILPQIGEFGKYQQTRFWLLCLPALVDAFQFGVMIFNIMPPPHWCKMPPNSDLPDSLRNLSDLELRARLIPQEEEYPGVKSMSKCKMRNFTAWNTAASNDSEYSSDTISCIYGWDVDHSAKWTLPSEWNLFCDQDYIGHLMLTLVSVGRIFGTFVFSILQDLIGRKTALFIAMPWCIFWGSVSVLMPTIWAYIGICIVRGLVGLALFQVPYILALEMVGPSKHTFIVNVMSIVFAMGMASVALVAWLCQTWRQLVICANGPFLVFMFLWFVLDESPRWLLSKGRLDEAQVIIEKIAKTNGYRITSEQMENLIQESDLRKPEHENQGSENFITMWKHGNLAALALVLAVLWSINAMVYVGLNYNSQNFGGNVYIVFALICLIEIPAEVFNFIVDYVGRIWPAGITMALSGLALLGASITPPSMTGIIIFLAILSKFCITASFCILYQIGAELFPTVLRGTAIGFATMISQVLSIVTPFIVYSSTALRILPMLILGGLSLFGGFLTFFLPETLNRRLPEHIVDTKKHTGFGIKALIGNITMRSLKQQRIKGAHD